MNEYYMAEKQPFFAVLTVRKGKESFEQTLTLYSKHKYLDDVFGEITDSAAAFFKVEKEDIVIRSCVPCV